MGQTIINFLTRIITLAPGLIMGVVLHEFAHGYIAYKSGDPTAKNMGRLTLNPIAHMDLFGSIILPLLLILFNAGIIFGYAKPVPVNPAYFRNFRKGMRYTSLAGPVTNLIFAFVIGLVYGLFYYIFFILIGIPANPAAMGYRVIVLVDAIFKYSIYINILLAIFNFIPVPPLDGSKIVASFLPEEAMHRYLSFGRFGFILIFILIYFGGRIIFAVIEPIYNIFTWWQHLIF